VALSIAVLSSVFGVWVLELSLAFLCCIFSY